VSVPPLRHHEAVLDKSTAGIVIGMLAALEGRPVPRRTEAFRRIPPFGREEISQGVFLSRRIMMDCEMVPSARSPAAAKCPPVRGAYPTVRVQPLKSPVANPPFAMIGQGLARACNFEHNIAQPRCVAPFKPESRRDYRPCAGRNGSSNSSRFCE
jgi:hypothetical protein